MERRLLLRLENSELFPRETKQEKDRYLSGISRDMMVKTGAYLVGFAKGQPAVRNNFELLSKWFNAENNAFANSMYKEIVKLQLKGIESVIVNIHTSLKFLEKAIGQGADHTQSNTDTEKNLFKFYLLLNEQDNEKDNDIFKSLDGQPESVKFPFLMLTQTFRYADVSSVNYKEIFCEQFVKATLFLKFIEKSHPVILREFLKYYNVPTWEKYLEKIFLLVKLCAANRKNGFTDITITQDEFFKENQEFIEKLSFTGQAEDLTDSDFISLRSKPLFKIDQNKYRVIYDLFVFEKVFNSIFFVLKGIKSIDTQYNLKDIFTFQFSEKQLLYSLMEKIFNHYDVRFSGLELEKKGINGAPDYYVRRGRRILVFESKDVVLNASVKESTSFKTYEEQIRSKLYYYDDENGRRKSKAVLQLISNVSKILQNQNRFDKTKPGFRIYPIIVVHHRQLNVAGLNHLLKLWFMEELNKLKDTGVSIKGVAQLTVINSSSLILYSDQLATKKYPLEKFIEEYHRVSSMNSKLNARSKIHLENELMSKAKPFNLYISGRIKSKGLPSIMRTNAKSLFRK